MTAFVKDQEYTMTDIRSAPGGDNMSYLPQSGRRIVCGRFTADMNNKAPYEVLVGNPPQVQRKARLMAQQGGSIPIFVKLAPGRWRFHGRMELVEYVTDKSTVEPKAADAGRSGEVVGVLLFRDTDA